MIVQRGFEQPAAYRGGWLSIGNFDGVHRGHQAILGELVRGAREHHCPAVVLTFDPHPITLLSGRAPPALTAPSRKAELIAKCGVDCLIVYPTTHELLALTAEEFFESFVRREMQARGMVEGPNFYFGKDRRGDVTLLGRLCGAAGLALSVVPPMLHGGTTVSSSVIRRAIAEGRIADAVEMLGHPFQIEGIVAEGARRGRQIGFPTANLAGVATLLPPDGVYAGTSLVDGVRYPAAVHLGPNPTFGEGERKLEAHLVGYRGDLYGRSLQVDLLDRVRGTQKFAGVEELTSQLRRDVERVEEIVQSDESRRET
jgi:riboflavin kinase/FMN adenylyltransferase